MNHINKMKICCKRKLFQTLFLGLLLISKFVQCAINVPKPYSFNYTTENLTYRHNPNATNIISYKYLLPRDFGFQDKVDQCMLGEVRKKMLWWVDENGKLSSDAIKAGNTIDLSWLSFRQDEPFMLIMIYHRCFDNKTIINKLSLAFNNLKGIPTGPLSLPCLQNLEYLTLTGNNITTIYPDSFAYSESLLELDLRCCDIYTIYAKSFQMLPKLQKLFLSYNNIQTLDPYTFYNLPNLWFLDFSYIPINNVPILSIESPNPFQSLTNLTILNLSHTILNNAMSLFANLPKSLKVLDVCYTGISGLTSNQFASTSLIALDLSHNPFLGSGCNPHWAQGLGSTLKYLAFTHSDLEYTEFLMALYSLEALKLSNNTLGELTSNVFRNMPNLRLLDVQENFLSNWYTPVFQYNPNLRLLDLRNNRMNVITSQMQSDFAPLDFLALSKNQLICSCIIRSLIDVSDYNFFRGKNMSNMLTPNMGTDILEDMLDMELASIFLQPYMNEYDKMLQSWKNDTRKIPALHFLKPPNVGVTKEHDALSSSLHLQLYDYNASQYLCYNVTQFILLEEYSCQSTTRAVPELSLSAIASHLGNIIGATFGVIILMMALAGLLYWKRWHIHYYYVVLKTAALWSMQAKGANDRFAKLDESEPHHLYDIFISYCQNDRDWVLEQLLPNIEQTDLVSLCLHERDFEIGVTIMDNIVSSMERSRSMMLVVSQRSLLSHWCQFEMVLAQQRIIESNNAQLLLVLLDDIPRSKRPKALQYLMKVKTYIKWPANSVEEQKIFWFRVQRSLQVGPFLS